jgi:chromosome segregation ATPase
MHQSSLPAKCSLEKRVNKKVMAMFEKAEDEYNDLMSKKNIIEVGLYSCIVFLVA